MDMNIHKTRANIGTLGIDDLATFKITGFEHLAIILNYSVFNQNIAIRNQVIPHNQLRIDNRNHKIILLFKIFN